MADETTNTDQAALDAVSNFWANEGRSEAAESEVPGEAGTAPVYTEAQQQEDELIEEGLVDPTTADGEPAPAPVAKTETTPKTEVAATGSETPVIDDDLRTIAKEQFGWTDEKIDRLAKADPELARETLETFAASYAAQTRQILTASPAVSAADVNQVKPAPVAKPAAPAIPDAISDAALAKFAETNGQEAADAIKAIRDYFAGELAKRDEVLGKYETAQQQAELRTIATEAKATFDELSTKHPALYGKNDESLTVVQQGRRNELAQLADQLRAGAAAQGRQMTVRQAITNAHYILSRGAVAQEARQAVVSKVVQRSKQIVNKPTARVNPNGAGQVKSDAAAMEAYAAKLAELGG